MLRAGDRVRVKPGVLGVNRRYVGREGVVESSVDISTVAMVLDGAESADDPEWVIRFGPNEAATLAESSLEVL